MTECSWIVQPQREGKGEWMEGCIDLGKGNRPANELICVYALLVDTDKRVVNVQWVGVGLRNGERDICNSFTNKDLYFKKAFTV